jgi:hypothetical protein
MAPRAQSSERRVPLTALIPLKITGRHYGENLARLDLLFSSLIHWAEPQLLGEVLIVTRADEVSVIKRHLSRWSELPLRIVIEDEHFPAFGRFTRPWQVRPWHRQQIIKLNASALTDAPFVLVLDPDVLAVKPLRYETLLTNGRALIEPEPRRTQRRWWLHSASLLGIDPGLDRPGMQVTPAILSTEILGKVHERLEEVWGRPWMEVLLTNYCEWTEFTLYLLTAEWGGLLSQYHLWADDPEAVAHLHVNAAKSVWYARSATTERVGRLFRADDDPGLFAVVQSNTGFPASEVASVAAEHIPVRATAPIDLPHPPRRAQLYEWLCLALNLGAMQLYRVRRRLRGTRVPLDRREPVTAHAPKPTPRPSEDQAGA